MEEQDLVQLRRHRLRTLLAAVGCVAAILALLWWRYTSTVPDYAMPRPALPQPNAFDYYLSAGDAVRGVRGHQLARSRSTSPEYLALVVEEGQSVLKTFRAGLQHPYLTPLADDALARRFDYLESFGRLGDLLWAESRAAAAIDDIEGALGSALDLVRLGTDVPRGGIPNHIEDGRYLEQMGLAALAALGEDLDAAQCRRALRRLDGLEARRVPLRDAIVRERDLLHEFLSLLSRRDPDAVYALDTYLRRRWSSGPRVLYLINLRGALRQLMQCTDEAIRLSAMPAGRRTPVTPPRHPLLERLDTVRRLRFILDEEDALQARAGLVRTALALRAYRIEQGRSPKALADLVPRYLPSVPQDPYGDGEALRYQDDPVPRAYSLGPDRSDDGGRVLPWRRLKSYYRRPGGDLVVSLGEYDMWRP